MRPRPRRVLMIGGPMDGKWYIHEGGGTRIQFMKTMDVRMISKEDSDPSSMVMPEYEQYILECVALYGEGLWIGMHKGALDLISSTRAGQSKAQASMLLLLRAILKRDVADELGL